MASIYIHIPFCKSRCIYCDFFSTTSLPYQEAYVRALRRELELRKGEFPSRAQSFSIYIGGGTPSTLPASLLQAVLRHVYEIYPVAEEAEVTVEANPDDVTEEWVAALRDTPVNRVSMGVQTFDDERLLFLRRRHTANQAVEAVERLRRAGFENLSIDLIYGLPGQTLPQWQCDVERAVALAIPHLSAYSLMFEEGTPLSRLRDEGCVAEMDEALSLQCYELLCERLQEAGYEHYEVSNFCKSGMHSRHNSAYWTGDAYLGFGAGAHSYDGRRTRRWNVSDLRTYISALETTGAKFFENEKLSDIDLYNEFVMTRLRTANGISVSELETRFGDQRLAYCLRMAEPHLEKGLLLRQGDVLRLSRGGVFVSNDIMSDLFLC